MYREQSEEKNKNVDKEPTSYTQEHTQMLFDNDKSLGTAKNQSELDELLKRYTPPYDPLYICLSTRFDLEKQRQWLEATWMECRQFADRDFVSKFKKECHQRIWELCLGITLHRKWSLQPKSKSTGPDFKTILNTNKGPQTVWTEAIAIEKGKFSNKVPEMVINGVGELPEDEMLLRLTNGLDKKYKGYCDYVKKGIVGADDPYIIAINRSELEHLDPQIPLILKCLFRLGYQVVFTAQGKSGVKATESLWTSKEYIMKKKESDSNLLAEEQTYEKIPMDFFDNPEHSEISAVIYAETDIIKSPISPEEMGDDFTIVLNPHANKPLPEELLTFGNIWRKEGNSVTRQKRFDC